jgi:hypothetical protein
MRSKQAPKTADAAKPAAKKAPEASVQGGDLDPKAVALPGGGCCCGAGGGLWKWRGAVWGRGRGGGVGGG